MLRLAGALLDLELPVRIANVQKNNFTSFCRADGRGLQKHVMRVFTWLPKQKPGCPMFEQKEKASSVRFPSHSQNSNWEVPLPPILPAAKFTHLSVGSV